MAKMVFCYSENFTTPRFDLKLLSPISSVILTSLSNRIGRPSSEGVQPDRRSRERLEIFKNSISVEAEGELGSGPPPERSVAVKDPELSKVSEPIAVKDPELPTVSEPIAPTLKVAEPQEVEVAEKQARPVSFSQSPASQTFEVG